MRTERVRPCTPTHLAWAALLALAFAGCATTPPPAAARLELLAPAACWAPPGTGPATALARCDRAGIGAVELLVAAPAAPGALLQACSAPANCIPLADALGDAGAPRRVLRTPVALLDDLQRALERLGATGRVLVAPVFDRPAGATERWLAGGVRYRREARLAPRPVMLHIVEVDLDAAGLQFAVTSGQPDAGLEFVAEKTSGFAARAGLLVAVNASYFRPFHGGDLLARAYVPAIGQAVEVDGLSISRGHVDSPAANADPRVDSAFCVTPRGPLIAADCPPDTTEAVGGGPVLLRAGRALPLDGAVNRPAGPAPAGVMSVEDVPRYFAEPQPRTALGIDPARRRLWLVVADGRQPGYSGGLSLPELTAVFEGLGATEAINLDGGGSSTLVLADAAGSVTVANSPIHTQIPGRERPVANHLGLRLARQGVP